MNTPLKSLATISSVIPGSLIFVEGLPGSGKTTMAHKIQLWLHEAGFTSRWISEFEFPHPITGNRMKREMEPDVWEPKSFIQESLTAWKALSQKILACSEVVVLESTLLQACAGKLQQMAVPYEEIKAYLEQVKQALGNLPTHLIFLWQDNPRSAIKAMLRGRRHHFKDHHLKGLPRFPYLANNYGRGQSGLLAYVDDYQILLSKLMGEGPFMPSKIDATDRHWPRIEMEVCTALGLSPPQTAKEFLKKFTGRFVCTIQKQRANIFSANGNLRIKVGKLTRDLLHSPVSAETLYICKNPHRLIWQLKSGIPHTFTIHGPATDPWHGSIWHRQPSLSTRLINRFQASSPKNEPNEPQD